MFAGSSMKLTAQKETTLRIWQGRYVVIDIQSVPLYSFVCRQQLSSEAAGFMRCLAKQLTHRTTGTTADIGRN